MSGFRGPASAVAPVRNEVRLNSTGPRSPPNYGQISAFNAVGPKLLAEVAFGFLGAGEDYQAARVFIQAMHSKDGGLPSGPAAR